MSSSSDEQMTISNSKSESKSRKINLCCQYKGPNTKHYSEEDFRGTVPLALVQSVLCTPILSYYLSEESQSSGQRLGARLATGIGFVVYGAGFAIISFFFKVLSFGIIIGGGITLIGIFYFATAMNMRRLLQKEELWKARKANYAPTAIIAAVGPNSAGNVISPPRS